jgi:hypothetical protein
MPTTAILLLFYQLNIKRLTSYITFYFILFWSIVGTRNIYFIFVSKVAQRITCVFKIGCFSLTFLINFLFIKSFKTIFLSEFIKLVLRKAIYHSSIFFNVFIIIIQTDEILMLFSMKKEEANRFIVDYKSGNSWS